MSKNDKERPLLKDLLCDPFIRKTMKEFVENKGQDIASEKIPIKKTLTHQEFKKILNEDINKQENETPYQQMMRRKIEQTRKQEEELKLAARQAHISKMEHKQRKYEDLFGTSPTKKNNNENTISNSQLIGQKSNLVIKPYQEFAAPANNSVNMNNMNEASNKFDTVKFCKAILDFFFLRAPQCFKLAKVWNIMRI